MCGDGEGETDIHAAGVTLDRCINESVDFGKGDYSVELADDLAAAHGYPDVVYVDVEGWECEVLAGAEQAFRKKPDWFIEVHQGAGLETLGGSVDRVLSYFAQDYHCYVAITMTANDYSDWNQFGLLDEANLPSGRFFLAAIATPG